MSTHAEELGDLEVYQHVDVTVDDETVVSGRANPIDFVPEESLRVELDVDEGDVRHQFTARYEDGEWSEVRAQRIEPDDEDWVDFGAVTAVEPAETEGESPDEVGAGE